MLRRELPGVGGVSKEGWSFHVFFHSQVPCTEDPVLGKARRRPAPTVVGREDTEGARWKGAGGKGVCLPSAVCLGDGSQKWGQGLETYMYPAYKGLWKAHTGPRVP